MTTWWAIGAFTALAMFGVPAAAHPPSDWLTCADTSRLNVGLRDRDALRVREIAPTTEARTSDELAALARLTRIVYELYDDYDAGGDLQAGFDASGLRLVGFIYGDPGLSSDRARGDRDTHTFYGFVADDPASGQRYFVFRGTLEPLEWARNAQVLQRDYPGVPNAHVHSGFFSIFESLVLETADGETPLTQSLPSLTSGRDTVFVGHSLGAAIATLVGVEASRLSPQDAARVRITTFGSPRVGDEGFAELAGRVGRIDRVCNVVDIVPQVPISTTLLTYIHVGSLVLLSSFDWPELNNAIRSRRGQASCWHRDTIYAYMLSTRKDAAQIGTCAK